MSWQGLQIAIVLALVAAVFFGFVRERLRPDVVALCAVVVLLLTGVLTTQEVLGVFSNSGPITVAAMFVLSAALERTGVIDAIGRKVIKTADKSPIRALVGLMLGCMLLSAFMNNTPVVAIMIPIVIALAHAQKIAPSRLLIPLSFATILGGTTTLVGTSTNLLVDGVAQRHGLAPFGIFEITAVGAILGLLGIAYLALVGRRLLPDRETHEGLLEDRSKRKFLAEVLVPFDSGLIGKRLAEAGFTEARGLRVIDLLRGDVSLRDRRDEVTLEAGDRLVLRSQAGDVMALREAGKVAFDRTDAHAIEPIANRETRIVEGMVGPQSRFVGQRVADLALRRLYGVYVLAVHRENEKLRGNFEQVRLHFGDTMLLEGPPDGLKRLFARQDLISLSQPSERPVRRTKAPIAVIAIALVMTLGVAELLPIAALAMIAATAVIALGCLEAEEAYQAIRWRILVLIFGMLALGQAMEKSGAAALIVEGMTALVAGFGPVFLLSAVYFMTMVLTELISNNAVAILMTPIAIGLAEHLGIDPRPFVVAVMFAASASFATPIGYQTNTLVYGAGGYRFTDFVKVGLPMNLMLWLAASALIPLFWPL